jgi:hypothetical protein
MKEGPGDKKPKNIGGFHKRAIRRDAKGNLQEGGTVSSTEMYASDNARKAEAKQADSTYSGTAAPRVGGGTVMKQGLPSGGSKKQIKAAKVRVKRSSASPAAKASARRLYR